MNTKKLTVALAISLIGIGCTSTPNPNQKPSSSLPPVGQSTLIHDPEVFQMSRTEVINATQECQDAGMRASTVTTKHRVGRGYVDVIVDVHCNPRYFAK